MSRSRHLVAPELREVIDSLGEALNANSIAELRASMAALSETMLETIDDSIGVEERRVPGPAGAPEVRLLIYKPADARTPLPIYYDIHGGGYVAGTADMDAAICRKITAGAGCAVVSVDYRISPEAQYPAAVEDCYAGLIWLAREGKSLGLDTDRIVIGGESAGGGHAAALALLLRDRGGPKILLQALCQPMLDDRTGTTSEPHPYAGEFVWTDLINRVGWTSLLGIEAGSATVPENAVPARVENLSGLAPAFIVVGSLDLFVEEDIEYARRLLRAGVPTELHVISGGFHGAAAIVPDAPYAQSYYDPLFTALTRAFGTA